MQHAEEADNSRPCMSHRTGGYDRHDIYTRSMNKGKIEKKKTKDKNEKKTKRKKSVVRTPPEEGDTRTQM